MTDSKRIILFNGSRFLNEMVKRALMKSPDLEVVGEIAHQEDLPKIIRETGAHWIIYFLQSSSDVPVSLEKLIVQEFPRVRILGISMDGSRVKLEWIGIRERLINDSSLDELTTLLRMSHKADEAEGHTGNRHPDP